MYNINGLPEASFEVSIWNLQINMYFKLRFLIIMRKLLFLTLSVLILITTGCKKEKEVTLESIAVTTQPTKKTYKVDEAFDLSGMIVTATYSDKSTAPVTITAAMLSYNFSKIGTNLSVTITYEGKTTTVTGITVTGVTLVSIAVTTQPTKKTYNVDDMFDPTGMVVTATYSDNSTAPITITAAMLSYNFSIGGMNKIVTITYEDKTTTVTGITVNPIDSNFAGAGTSDDPFEIDTPKQLAKLAELVNAGNPDYYDKYFKLTADIDLSYYGEEWNNGKGWIPIGNAAFFFRSKFDGAGYTVSGLYINNSDFIYSGLFGFVYGGTIANLSVTNVDIRGNYVGGVAGMVSNGSSITKCYVTGTVEGDANVGGVAGIVQIGSSVSNCYATGTVEGNAAVGGVVGSVHIDSNITNCYSTGTVKGDNQVGGVIGWAGDNSSVTNCYAACMVEGNYIVGGVVGGYSGNLLTNCAALNPSIKRTSGTELSFWRVGFGLTLNNNVALVDMEALGDITFGTGAHDNLNGESISTEQAKQQATYTGMGWNFTTVWKINEGVGYPKLMWE